MRAAEKLIQHGADINMKTYKAFTPLHLSVISAEVEVMELLLRSGCDVNINSDDGKTPIHTACKNGEESIKLSLFRSHQEVYHSSHSSFHPHQFR